jgi:hypothetical protein
MQLDGVSRTLSSVEELNARQAERVAARMEFRRLYRP